MTKILFALIFVLIANSCGICLAQQPGSLLWSYTAGSAINTSPTLAPDGTIYIGTYAGLYAITNAGSNKWTFPAGQSLNCSPAIGSDGVIYFGDDNANFYAINPNGSQKWMFALQPEFQYKVTYQSSPTIGLDGSIYFTASGRFYAFTSSGTKKWEHVIDTTSQSQAFSPTIGNDGTIYIGSGDNRAFYALNSDGTEKWVFGLNNSAGESAAIGADGTIYVTGNYLYAVSPYGTNLWASPPQDFGGASPAIGNNGNIYIAGASDHRLYAFSAAGGQLWRIISGPTGFGYPTTTPAIDVTGMIYYAWSNSVFAVTPQGNVEWTFSSPLASYVPPAKTPNSPAIGPDGTIYAAFGSTLYALKGTNTLGNTPWPMYRQNPRHTGKVEKPTLQTPKKRADANFQFQLYGEVGQSYEIQRSTNLSLWSSLTNLVATNPPAIFIDLTASNFTATFYRAAQQ